MNNRSLRIIFITTLFVFFPTLAFSSDRIRVMVSVVPQKYFVQQIGGDLVSVEVMVRPGASPATYEPRPRQMASLSRTQIYFTVGVAFESAWLDDIAAMNPQMKIIRTDHGIKKREMVTHHHEDEDSHQSDNLKGNEVHDHGNDDHHDGHAEETRHEHEEENHYEEPDEDYSEDHHDHTGLDPHIWLSPRLVKDQARTMMVGLSKIDPEHQEVFRENYHKFTEELNRLDQDLKSTLRGKEGMAFMVFHPAWGYFADAYGLRQIAIEVEGKDPKPAIVRDLIHEARSKGIKIIFAQPQFSTRSAKLISKEIGGEVVLADPLAEDWLSNIRDIATKFKSALK